MFEATDYLNGLNSALGHSQRGIAFDYGTKESKPRTYCCDPEVSLELPMAERFIINRVQDNGKLGPVEKFIGSIHLTPICGGCLMGTDTAISNVSVQNTITDYGYLLPFIKSDDIHDPKFAKLAELWAAYRAKPTVTTRLPIKKYITEQLWPTEKVMVISSRYAGYLMVSRKYVPYQLI